MEDIPFILAVISSPVSFPGEADHLEGLLEAGLQKLHLRKPGKPEEELVPLLDRLSSRWLARLVLHGSPEMASRFGVPQVHVSSFGLRASSYKLQAASYKLQTASCELRAANCKVSTSVHSWEELAGLPPGLAYAFISPLFDSISKPGYSANISLLEGNPVLASEGVLPCKALGLGGIDANTIRELVRKGWDGAVALGWIWERPAEAVSRFRMLEAAIREELERSNERLNERRNEKSKKKSYGAGKER